MISSARVRERASALVRFYAPKAIFGQLKGSAWRPFTGLHLHSRVQRRKPGVIKHPANYRSPQFGMFMALFTALPAGTATGLKHIRKPKPRSSYFEWMIFFFPHLQSSTIILCHQRTMKKNLAKQIWTLYIITTNSVTTLYTTKVAEWRRSLFLSTKIPGILVTQKSKRKKIEKHKKHDILSILVHKWLKISSFILIICFKTQTFTDLFKNVIPQKEALI